MKSTHVKSLIFPTLESGDIQPLVMSSFFRSTDIFDKQLTQQGRYIHMRVHFEYRPNSGRAIPEKLCPILGAKMEVK